MHTTQNKFDITLSREYNFSGKIVYFLIILAQIFSKEEKKKKTYSKLVLAEFQRALFHATFLIDQQTAIN